MVYKNDLLAAQERAAAAEREAERVQQRLGGERVKCIAGFFNGVEDWINFCLCFAATPGGGVRRKAGWARFYNGCWWVKRHICDGVDGASWVQAKTRSGCVRYLARWVLLDIKKTGDFDAADPKWPVHAAGRARLALELRGKMAALLAESG